MKGKDEERWFLWVVLFYTGDFADLFQGVMWCRLLSWEDGGDCFGAAMRNQPPRSHLEAFVGFFNCLF